MKIQKQTRILARFFILTIGWAWCLTTTPANAHTSEFPELPDAIASYQSGDIKGALDLWEQACDLGNPRGCFHAAVVFRDGEIGQPDKTRSDILFEQACSGGFGAACFNLGNNSDGLDQIRYFERGCAVSDIGSCARLGMAYRDGTNVEPDPEKAVNYLSRSCLINDLRAGPACFELASIYDAHLTALFDKPQLANHWLDKGCARNHAASCQNLAWHYAHGFGLEVDYVMSAALYQLACDDNAQMSCFFIPTSHRISENYLGDYVADEWRLAGGAYEKACNKGLAHGCFALARLIAKSGNGMRGASTMRGLLERAIAIDLEHIAAVELLRRLEAGELPDRVLR